jgi:hypothetical protein
MGRLHWSMVAEAEMEVKVDAEVERDVVVERVSCRSPASQHCSTAPASTLTLILILSQRWPLLVG